jgi:hypothetical protein
MSDDRTPEELARDLRRREMDDMAMLMSSVQGRRLAYRILSWCGIYRTSFSSEPLIMARNEGSREIGLRFLAELSECAPAEVYAMLREAHAGRPESPSVQSTPQ